MVVSSMTRFLSGTLLPFYFRVPLLKPNSKKKGTLIVMGLLKNLVKRPSGCALLLVFRVVSCFRLWAGGGGGKLT